MENEKKTVKYYFIAHYKHICMKGVENYVLHSLTTENAHAKKNTKRKKLANAIEKNATKSFLLLCLHCALKGDTLLWTEFLVPRVLP